MFLKPALILFVGGEIVENDMELAIQALERAQGYLKLPNGRALTGQSHDYKRHGTTTLFAALEVATGRIIAAHSKRRRRVGFLSFMNSIVAAFQTSSANDYVVLIGLSVNRDTNVVLSISIARSLSRERRAGPTRGSRGLNAAWPCATCSDLPCVDHHPSRSPVRLSRS